MEKLSESSSELKLQNDGSIVNSISKYKKIIFGLIIVIIIGFIAYYLWNRFKKPIVNNTPPIRKNILKNEENFSAEENNVEENFDENNNVEENFEENNNVEDNNSINLEGNN